jgi:hypothetical protein
MLCCARRCIAAAGIDNQNRINQGFYSQACLAAGHVACKNAIVQCSATVLLKHHAACLPGSQQCRVWKGRVSFHRCSTVLQRSMQLHEMCTHSGVNGVASACATNRAASAHLLWIFK